MADSDRKIAPDFRRLSAAVVQKWLDLRSKDTLTGIFEQLTLLRS